MMARFIAQEQPPHLAAIAPWEGLGDFYRQSICRGGIPDHAFWDLLFTWSGGKSPLLVIHFDGNWERTNMTQ